MTSSANDEWDYESLKTGLHFLETERKHSKIVGASQEAAQLEHTIDFIEYNMREMEITEGNGD